MPTYSNTSTPCRPTRRSGPPPPTPASLATSPRWQTSWAALIVAGTKTATCGAVCAYEAEGSPLPTAGMLTVVLAGNNEPLCIIETTEAVTRPFNEVDAQFAYEEGEDDRSLASWRHEHWKFFSRVLPRDYGLQPAEDMPLVCERFRVVYP